MIERPTKKYDPNKERKENLKSLVKEKYSNLVDVQEFADILINRLKEFSLATFERSFNNVKDGLRPVNRRALYTMYELGITNQFKKVQYVSGAEMKYHPYNSDTIADSITILGQWFSTSHPYLDTQGNFGSINDLYSYAAPRYIECKLSKFAQDCITNDIDDHCIIYSDNYDNTFKEPDYLPSKIPLSLIQSSWGLGEAFMNSIPPYNLRDVVDCCIKVIRNKNIPLKELMKGIYPDYPTGGIIINKSEVDEFQSLEASQIEKLSREGKTYTIKTRAKCEIDRENSKIKILELPDGVDFMSIWEKIMEEVKEKNNVILSGIINKSDYVDKFNPNTDKENIVFELICKKDANLLEILDQLYLKTPMSNTQSLSFILYNGQYLKRMSFKDIILEWYKTQCDVKRRKFNFLLSDTSNKIHVLEGLVTVYDKMDEVIATIKSSKDKQECVEKLVNKFKLSLVQAKGISEMQLLSLTRSSKDSLLQNIKNHKMKIDEYEDKLINLDDCIIEDLIYMKNKYGRNRRTEVTDIKQNRENRTSINMSNGALLYSRDSIGIFDITALSNGKTILNSMKPIKVNGKNTKEIIGYHPITNNITGLIVFNKDGTAKRIKISEIPATNNWIITNDANFQISCVVPIYEEREDDFVIVINNEYKIKKFRVSEIGKKVQTGVILAAKIVPSSSKNINYLIYSRENGDYLYIDEEEIPELSRNSAGVMTSFKEGESFGIIDIDNSKDENLLIAFLCDELSGYYTAIDEMQLEITKRTNKPKKMFKLKTTSLCGLGLINSKEKNNSNVVFIGPYNTYTVKGKTVKDAMDPKKINMKPFGVIQIKE